MVSYKTTQRPELLNHSSRRSQLKRELFWDNSHLSTLMKNKSNIFRLLLKDGLTHWTSSWMNSNFWKWCKWRPSLTTPLERSTCSQYQSLNTSPRSNTSNWRIKRESLLSALNSHKMFLLLLRSQYSSKTERKRLLLELSVLSHKSTIRLKELWPKVTG